MGLLDGLGRWLKNEFDQVTGQPAPRPVPTPQAQRAPMAPPGQQVHAPAPAPVPPQPQSGPLPVQPVPIKIQRGAYPNLDQGVQHQVLGSTHLNDGQKTQLLQRLNNQNQPIKFNPVTAAAQALGGAVKDTATGLAQSVANVPASVFHAGKAVVEHPFNPQAAQNEAATAKKEFDESLVGQVANPAIRLAKTVGQAGAVLTPDLGSQNEKFKQNLQGFYYRQARQQGMNDAQARTAALQHINTVAQRNLSGTDVGQNDSYADVGRRVLSDYGQTVANLYGGEALTAPKEAATTILDKVAQVASRANEVGKAGAVVNATAAAHDTTDPATIAKAAGEGYLGGALAGGVIHGAPLVADVVKSGARKVADMTTGPALATAERSSGLSRDSIINDNEAGTLRDYADYKTGSYRPAANTINQLDMQARNAAKTAGIDVTSGSPVDITNRIYNYLGQRDHFITTHDAIMQGGYAQVPFLENGESEVDPFTQNYAAEKTPQEIIQEHADMMRTFDQSARGGVIAENGTRSTEHSPFYSQYYAEHGRAPSKAAYLEQATKELEDSKGDMLDPGMADAYQIAKQRQAEYDALAQSPPKDLNSYYYGENLNPDAFTENDPMLAEAKKKPVIAIRNAEAEQQALGILQNGGTRDEAIAAYQKTARVSAKNARYQVQRAAKEAEQALNVSKATPNPLLEQYQLPTPKAGEFERVSSNRRATVNSIDLAERRALAYEKQLTPTDKANLIDYIQGTRDIANAENPALVKQTADAWRQAADTVHAVGENFGHTKHIENFFPGYWDRENPEVMEMERLQAEQDLEEKYGTQEWNRMSQTDKEKALASYIQRGIDSDANYGGFHNKAKTFKTQAEGIAAGYKPLFENPFDAMRRYFAGAKLQLGNQAIIQGIGHAEPAQVGQRFAINLPGSEPVSVGKEGFKILKGESIKPPSGKPIQILKGTTRTIVRTIVANPLIHGQNQEFNALFSAAWNEPGFKPANMMKIIGGQFDLARNPAEMDKWRTDYYAHGGFSPDYGKEHYGFIAKGLQKVGIDPKHAEFSPRAMAALEENIRIATYKMGIERGMTSDAAIKAVDDALGSSKVINDTASTFGLFVHYFTTNTKILGRAGLAVTKGNLNPLIGLAVGYAAYTAANKAWQAVTGNPDASVRAPGVIGTAQQLAGAPGQLAQGKIPSVITSHVNPLLRIGVEQATNRDLSKPVFGAESAGNTLQSPSGNTRAIQILKDAVGPAQDIIKLNQSKMSPAELAGSLALGLYTPHAAGYQASPNIKILNAPYAQNGNGLASEKQYFDAKDAALNSLNSQKDVDDFNAFLDKYRTPDGKTVLNSQAQTAHNWAQLASNPTVLHAMQQFYQKQDSHSPEWDLNFNGSINGQGVPAIQIWAAYKGLAPGSLERDVMTQQNPWITNLEQEVGSWASQLAKSDKVVYSPDYVPYPNIAPQQQQMMSTVTQLASIPAGQRSPEQIKQLSDLENDSGLQQAYSALQNYTNNVRAKMNLPKVQYAPNTPPEVQNFINQYMAPGMTAVSRKALQQKYPTLYNQMQAALEQQELATVDKEGGIGYYGGNQKDSFLSGVYGLGNYDIAKVPNANGTNSYALINYANNTPANGIGQNGLPTIDANNPNSVSASKAHSSSHHHHIYMKTAKRIRVFHPRREKKIFLQTPVSPVKIRNRANRHVGIHRTTYL